ncbi:MAG: ribose-phosphate pyrophosphokinase [Candidatus Eremiobacterota bacterium]
MRLFALHPTVTLGEQVAARLGIELSPLEDRTFEDGEHKVRPLVSVRNRDVFVLHSLYGDPEQSVNDKLCRLLFFVACLRDASAARVHAVLPYLCYARKDRRSKTRDPVTSRYVAQLLEAVGVHRVVTLDAHNQAAFENAHRCVTEHLEARDLFVAYLAPLLARDDVAVVSPDIGGIKRADRFREALEKALGRQLGAAFLEKRRSEGQVSGDALVGDVAGRVALLVDDLVSSGTTLIRAARACREAGASRALGVATHGVFAAEADRALSDPALESLMVSDSVPPFRLSSALGKVRVVPAAGLLAEAIGRIHRGDSLAEMAAPL